MKTTLTALLVLLLAACASTKVTDKLDEQYETKTSDAQETIGTKDDKIVIQKRIYLEEQLQVLQSEVEDLQHQTYGKTQADPGGLWETLRRCETRRADARVGGDGSPEAVPTWQDHASQAVEFAHTVEGKNVIAVTEEALADRIVRLQKSKKILSTSSLSLREKLERCENLYKTALIQHGLNPDDTQAKGEWVEGDKGYKVWKMKRSATNDPEELMKRAKKRQN